MSKQWVRQQIRHDEVQDTLDRGVAWVTENRQKAATVAGGVLLLTVVAGVLLYQSRAGRAAAWERLSLAQTYAYSGRPDTSLEQLKQLVSEQPSSAAAGYGLVFAGDLLFQRGQYKEAAQNYAKVIERGEPAALLPVALSDLALSQEAEGDFQQTIVTAQRFLDAHPEHYLAPQVHCCLARAFQATAQADLAKAALQKIQLQYPDTPWAAWAQSRLKGS